MNWICADARHFFRLGRLSDVTAGFYRYEKRIAGPSLRSASATQESRLYRIFTSAHTASGSFLRIEDVPGPQFESRHVLLRVVACGVCRTDLHIVEKDLPPVRPQLIPGHQIVGKEVEGATAELPLGTNVSVFWMGGVNGDCWYCHHGMENLCDKPTFTGYTVDGGYAEYALVRTDSTFPLPAGLDDVHAAPLLCAGIIGFRSLRVGVLSMMSEWDFLALGVPQVWQLPFCNPGNAKSMLRPEVHPIETWLSPSAPRGSAKKMRSRSWPSTVRHVRSQRKDRGKCPR
jgi:hypothetical protein